MLRYYDVKVNVNIELLHSFYLTVICSVILIMLYQLLLSITKNILDGDLALPWSKVDFHLVVSLSQVLLEVLAVAALETPAGGGHQDRDGVRVAVRAEDSHSH